MIKFFRKIRYDLMEKNNTGKYLKYAIGEISCDGWDTNCLTDQ
jgi:hypothetical protein